MRMIYRFFSKALVVFTALFFALPSFCAESNLPMADIGEYGTWATPNNRELFINQMTADIEKFHGSATTQLIDDYVPIEAKLGLAFMNAFSFVGHVLDASLVRFTILFIIIMYGLWVMFEAYTIIIGKSELQSKIKEIIKKAFFVSIWTGVLLIGPAKTFMMIMSPIIDVGTYISDTILNAVASIVGADLPDTCGAIQRYATAHISESNLLNATSAANIMCVPTRLSGFCATAIAVGWKWMVFGIGSSAFSFLCGAAFVGGFVYLGWKFAFMAFGIIADLFLGIIMLPFTALAETLSPTSYKGIAGTIYNGFAKMFSAESLQAQVMRFINAMLHFIVLSIVISVCTALLSGVINTNTVNNIPRLENTGFWVTILVSALTWYLASNASKLATDLGGSINASMGETLRSDINTLSKDIQNTASKWWKIIKESKK